MRLEQLKYFIMLSQCLSFTDAAKNLYIPQPYLSKQIAGLEHEIGVQLFSRTKRSVKLTKAGAALFEKLDGIPDLIEQAIKYSIAIDRGAIDRLSIGFLDGQEIDKNLYIRLRSFYSTNPLIEINFERASFRALRDGLEKRYYDVIITRSSDVEEQENISYVTICDQMSAIAINKNNPKANKKNLTLEDIKDEPFVSISPDESPGYYKSFIKWCDSCGFQPQIVKYVTSRHSQILCAETGIGLALVDRISVLEADNRLRLIDIPDSQYNSGVVIAWRKGERNKYIMKLVSIFSPMQES